MVVLENYLNGEGSFEWRLLKDSNDDCAFSIEPTSGSVDAYSEQICVITYRLEPQGFDRPLVACFICHVTGGDQLRLEVAADLGLPKLRFSDSRIQLDNLSLLQVRRGHTCLLNTGSVDALYKVSDIPAKMRITVEPRQGCIPAGGRQMLTFTAVPVTMLRLHTSAVVQIRGAGTIAVAVNGSVEPPHVVSDTAEINFGGVICHNQQSRVFQLENRSKASVTLEVDLKDHPEFILSAGGEPMIDSYVNQSYQHIFTVCIGAQKTLSVKCAFAPKTVDNHEFRILFHLQVPAAVFEVLQELQRSSHLAMLRDSSSAKNLKSSSTDISLLHMPEIRVVATACNPPIVIYPSPLVFEIDAKLLERCFKISKRIRITNNVARAVQLTVNAPSNDCLYVGDANTERNNATITRVLCAKEELLLPITFVTSLLCSNRPTTIRAHLPIYVDGESDSPATVLHIQSDCQPTYLKLKHSKLHLGVVPLNTQLRLHLDVICYNYIHPEKLTSNYTVMDICSAVPDAVPKFSTRLANKQFTQGGLPEQVVPLIVTFIGRFPVSMRVQVTVTDFSGRNASAELTVLADNSLLTIYPFLCLNRDVVQNGTKDLGRKEGLTTLDTLAVLTDDPIRPNFGTSGTKADVDLTSRAPTATSTREELCSTDVVYMSSDDCSSFPSVPASGAAQVFHTSVYEAVESWFQQFGFPLGVYPFCLFRQLPLCQERLSEKHRGRKENTQTSTSQNFCSSLYYLSNKRINIPTNSNDADIKDGQGRAVYLVRKSQLQLDSLRKEGALLSHIRPELMLDYETFQVLLTMIEEFHKKSTLNSNTGKKGDGMVSSSAGRIRSLDNRLVTPSAIHSLVGVADHIFDYDLCNKYSTLRDLAQFERVSQQVWTDLLLQTFQLFILRPCNSPRTDSSSSRASSISDETSTTVSDSASDNIHSGPERHLLDWLTSSYQQQLVSLWGIKSVDTSRMTINNFDSDLCDGVALCALFATYCPFLRDRFATEVYHSPKSRTQAFHNCALISEACDLLNLDVRLNVTSIVQPNPVSLLILCVVLYEKLPHYTPKQTISFRPDLGSTQSRPFAMPVKVSRNMAYHAKILGDTHVFHLREGLIPPSIRKSSAFTVDCTVRHIGNYNGTLLICPRAGQVPRPLPVVARLQASTKSPRNFPVVDVTSALYAVRSVHLNISLPNGRAGVYSARLTGQLPGERTSGEGDRWTIASQMRFPPITLPSTVTLNERGQGSITVSHTPWAAFRRDLFMLLHNAELGEHVVCFRSTPTSPEPFASVNILSNRLSFLQKGVGGMTSSMPECKQLISHLVTSNVHKLQVTYRETDHDLSQSVLKDYESQLSAVASLWILLTGEVLCTRLRLTADLEGHLRGFLENCVPLWETEEEGIRRHINGVGVSSETVAQFQRAKYCSGDGEWLDAVPDVPDAPEPRTGCVVYKTHCSNKDFCLHPRFVQVPVTAGESICVDLCLSYESRTAGLSVTELQLISIQYLDVVSARVAVFTCHPGRHKTRE